MIKLLQEVTVGESESLQGKFMQIKTTKRIIKKEAPPKVLKLKYLLQ